MLLVGVRRQGLTPIKAVRILSCALPSSKVFLDRPYKVVRVSDNPGYDTIQGYRYYLGQYLRRVLGFYPDIGKVKGRIKVLRSEREEGCNQVHTQRIIVPESKKSSPKRAGGGVSDNVLRAVERRLFMRSKCGKHGTIGQYKHRESGQVAYKHHPIRCRSVLCPHCAWLDSKDKFERLEALLTAIREPLAFLTLTFPSFQGVLDAVNTALAVKRKFYQSRLFGKKKWDAVKKKALELLDDYLSHVKDEKEREDLRRFHLWTIEQFEAHWKDYLHDSKAKWHIGKILRSVWKFEITYSPQAGWHPHFHVIVVGYFPLFVLQALWVMAGGGPVIDMRAVKPGDKGAIAELSKYEAKPVVSLDGIKNLPEDLQRELELVLYNRRLFEVWGMKDLLTEPEKEWEFLGIVRKAESELDLPNLHDLPKQVRELRKLSKKEGQSVMMELCDAVVRLDSLDLRFRVKAFLDSKGNIWLVGSDDFDRALDECGVWGRRRRASPEVDLPANTVPEEVILEDLTS